jgi:tRNA(fMet)-specific endonuclease VapC
LHQLPGGGKDPTSWSAWSGLDGGLVVVAQPARGRELPVRHRRDFRGSAPAPALLDYLAWLESVPREEQFTSAVVLGELYEGAFRSHDAVRHLRNVEKRVLPALTVLSFDLEAARVFGQMAAALNRIGRPVADADLQIAAAAIRHDLAIVTGNIRHFTRIPGLRIEPALARARRR